MFTAEILLKGIKKTQIRVYTGLHTFPSQPEQWSTPVSGSILRSLKNMSLTHQEGIKTFVWLIGFSSTFNGIQPHITTVTEPSWIFFFNSDIAACADQSFSSMGSPPLRGVSFPLFLYTNERQSQHAQCHIIKFADGSVIVSLLNRDTTLIVAQQSSPAGPGRLFLLSLCLMCPTQKRWP